jgi:hypothetical protein
VLLRRKEQLGFESSTLLLLASGCMDVAWLLLMAVAP